VVVNLKAKKRLAARVTGVGVHRIRFDTDHLDDIADAITRENIRSLITANTKTKEVQHKVPNKEEKVQE
jgi:large subunit ribosomal protein L19e